MSRWLLPVTLAVIVSAVALSAQEADRDAGHLLDRCRGRCRHLDRHSGPGVDPDGRRLGPAR